MEGLDKLLESLPSWAGTLPQWGIFVLLIIAVVRTSPQWLTTLIEARHQRLTRYDRRIKELEERLQANSEKYDAEIKSCRDECDRQTAVLQDEIWGMRRQHIQEQISLINSIISSVESPELKGFLRMLESVQRSLPRQGLHIVPGVEGDAAGRSDERPAD